MRGVDPLGRYLLTALLARLADEGMGIALALLALERTGSAADGGLVLAAWMAPHLLAAPLTGVYAGRSRRPRLFYGGALASFGTAIAVLALLVGWAPLPLALGVAAVGGACGPVVSGGLSGLLASLVPEPRRARAYGLDAAAFNTAWVAGPATVALLAAAASPAVAAGVLAAAAGGAAGLALTLPAPPGPVPGSGDGAGVGAELAAGLRALTGVRELRAITAASCLAIFGMGGVTLLAVLLAARHGSAGGGGLLLTLLALGALVASLLVARRPPAIGPRALAVRSLLVTGAALAAAAAAPSFALCAVCFALAGLGEGPLLSATLRLRAEHAPAALRTQVFTLGAGLKIGAAAGGAALTAVLSARWSPTALLLAVAAVQFAAAGLLRAAAADGGVTRRRRCRAARRRRPRPSPS